MTRLLAVMTSAPVLGALLWALAGWAAFGDGSDQRTITVLSGRTAHYAVVRHPSGLVLDLMLRVDDYQQLEAFLRCQTGCRVRVYIVQERKE